MSIVVLSTLVERIEAIENGVCTKIRFNVHMWTPQMNFDYDYKIYDFILNPVNFFPHLKILNN